MKSILFDLDGTIIDPREGILDSVIYALEHLDVPVPDEDTLLSFIGPPLTESFGSILGQDDSASIRKAIALYRERFSQSGWKGNELYEGITGLLTDCQQSNITMYIATTKPTRFARQILERYALATSFHGIYGSEMDGTRSDKTELIDYVISQHALDRTQCAMLGDRRHDMVGACNNRVLAIGAGWGYGSRDELLRAGAEKMCRSPADVMAALETTIL